MKGRNRAAMYKEARVVRGDADSRWLVIVQKEGWGGEFLLATCGSPDDAELIGRLLNRRYQHRGKGKAVP